MQKGILLEVEGRTGVVLTPKGEFKRVPLPQGAREVGEEIAFQESGGWRWGWLAAAAAVLLLVFTPLGYQQWQLAQPMALLMIDINPSIQLTLNSREQVIAAEGLNADGEAVLEGITWRRRPVSEVTRAVAAEAVAAGKLDPAADGSTVVVAVAPAKGDELPAEFSQALVEESRSALEAEVSTQAESRGISRRTEVAVVAATADEVKQAREQDLTLPRLIILEELRADHPEVTADAIRELPPAQILKELGISPSEIFSRAEERHNRSGDIPALDPDDDDDDNDKKPGNGNGRNNNNGRGNSNDDNGDDDDDDEKPGNGNGRNNNNGNGNSNDDNGDDDDDDGKPGKGLGRDKNNGNGNGKGNSPDDDGDKPGKGLGRDNNNGKGNDKGNSGIDGDDNNNGDDRDDDDRDDDDRNDDDDDERGTNSASNPGQGAQTPGQGSSGVTDPGDDDADGAPGQGQGNPGKGNGNAGKGNPGKGNGKGNPGVGGDDDDDLDDADRDKDDRGDEDDETEGRGKGNNGKGNGNGGSKPGRGNAGKLDEI